MTEWSKVPVLKTGVRHNLTEGSNPSSSVKNEMKIIKILRIKNPNNIIKGSEHRTFNVNKSELSSIKVLEKMGLIYKVKGTELRNKVNITPNFKGTLQVHFTEQKSMSCDEIRILSSKIKFGGKPKIEGSVVTFIFTTEKGMLSQVECMKYGIGGKIFSLVSIKK